jgi:hypothetical protein
MLKSQGVHKVTVNGPQIAVLPSGLLAPTNRPMRDVRHSEYQLAANGNLCRGSLN